MRPESRITISEKAHDIAKLASEIRGHLAKIQRGEGGAGDIDAAAAMIRSSAAHIIGELILNGEIG